MRETFHRTKNILKLLDNFEQKYKCIKSCNRFILNINKEYINKNNEIDVIHIHSRSFVDLKTLLNNIKDTLIFNTENSLLDKKDIRLYFHLSNNYDACDLTLKLLDIEFEYSIYKM